MPFGGVWTAYLPTQAGPWDNSTFQQVTFLEPLIHPASLQAVATGSQFIALILVQQRLRHRLLTWWTIATALYLTSSLILIVGDVLGGIELIQGPLAMVSIGIGYSIWCGARRQAVGRPSPKFLLQVGAGAVAWLLLKGWDLRLAVAGSLVLLEYWIIRAAFLLLRDQSSRQTGARLTGVALFLQAAILLTYPFAFAYPPYAEFGTMAISLFTFLQGWGVLLMVLSDTEQHLQALNDELQVQVAERTSALIRAERMAMLGQIAAKVAHELKNKLNVINAALYFLSQDHVTADRRERTRLRVEQTITSTAQLIGDLLQLARPQQTETGPVDLAEVLDPILHAVVPATVRVERHIPEGLPTVLADRQQVEQVLLNVVINAVEAMPHGGTLAIALQYQDGQVWLTIADSGEGVAPADLPKVFETFWTTKPQGTGLGLSISRSLIEQHGGSIQMATGEDRGTQVVIQLPAVR